MKKHLGSSVQATEQSVTNRVKIKKERTKKKSLPKKCFLILDQCSLHTIPLLPENIKTGTLMFSGEIGNTD